MTHDPEDDDFPLEESFPSSETPTTPEEVPESVVDSAGNALEGLWKGLLGDGLKLLDEAKADIKISLRGNPAAKDQIAIISAFEAAVTAAITAGPAQASYVRSSMEAQARAFRSGLRVRAAMAKSEMVLALVGRLATFVAQIAAAS